jgi:hypothetical protein
VSTLHTGMNNADFAKQLSNCCCKDFNKISKGSMFEGNGRTNKMIKVGNYFITKGWTDNITGEKTLHISIFQL